MDPSILIPILEDQLTWFTSPDDELIMINPATEATYYTYEGAAVWQNTIDFLTTQAALAPLEWDANLFAAA